MISRAAIWPAALAVVNDPRWADLFAQEALAEVPIAALIPTAAGPQAVAGVIDRLVITPDAIRLVDYKTARRPPAGLDDVPVASLRQMAAYVAALESSFRGAAWRQPCSTPKPRLIAIPRGDRAAQNCLGPQEQSFTA
jgi:ATP-dependent helicase/nuclease subunit A